MPPPNSLVLKQLDRLDGSSPEFHDQLCNVLYGREYKLCMQSLQHEDLVWLIDYLDKALEGLDPSSTAFRKCLHGLSSICGTRAMLPTSYTLPPDLLNIDSDPFTRGGYGDVYQGTFNGSKVCVKRMRVYAADPQNAAKTFCKEAVMWKRLTHSNILPLLGVTIEGFQLISNWMSGGHLLDYVKNNPDTDRIGLLSDIAKGLCYLHSCNIIHGDLKGLNILVNDFGHALITDFGLAAVTRNLDSVLSAPPQRGHTKRWAAPELLDEGPNSKEADIFAFAMVMIKVFTGAVPFCGRPDLRVLIAVVQGERPTRPTHPTLTEKLWTLMQRCWDQDPQLRPDVSEALEVLLTPEDPAWKLLISHTLATHERISLITAIFSDKVQVDMVENLSGDDAQNFIDVVYEALDSLEPQIRMKCLRPLYRICGRQALLPKSLAIPLCYDPMATSLFNGGSADVWKGRYNGRDVAAKALRVYLRDDLWRVRRMFCKEVVAWGCLRHPNVLPLLGVTMSKDRFVMVSEWMENGTIAEFVKVHADADRLKLLRDVAMGLIYMHNQGIIHGDLKGANILIDRDGRARLIDFAQTSMVSNQSTSASSLVEGGTIQWMSPELLDPESFGLRRRGPTKESDCYAMGMVVYEVLSGQKPFAPSKTPPIFRKVLDGERPERPQGNNGKHFTDEIWRVVQLCWMPQPRDRISAKDILLGLEGNPIPLRPSSNADGDVEIDSDDLSDSTASDSGLPIPQDGAPPQDQPQTGIAKGGRIRDRLAHNARKMFKAATRKLFGP